MPGPTSDVIYRWHRLALAGGDPSASRATLTRTLAALSPGEFPAFIQFLVRHKLAALWHQKLESADLLGSMDHESVGILRTNRISNSALYLAQRQALTEIDRLFERHSIAYVAIKGTSIRERLYADPALRPASDIDILVAPAQRLEAARVLIESGYQFHANPENIDWEATFSRGAVAIDLHWNILRSGRTRREVASGLLSRRLRQDSHWNLSPSDSVVVMLVHPAFTKYVTSPNMALISVVDFILLLRAQKIEWDAIENSLAGMGLKTAAWTVLTWFRIIAGEKSLSSTDDFWTRLQPSSMRRRYIDSWIINDLATRWIDHPLPIQLCFTLALHDRPSDTARAIAGWFYSRHVRHIDPMMSLGRDRELLSLS